MGLTQKSFFNKQLAILNNVINCNTMLIGDLNLDYNHLEAVIEKSSLLQIVDFDTWSRIVMNENKVH